MNEDLSSLPPSELKVYDLILNKLHASFGYPLKENITKIVAEIKNETDIYEFTIAGKVVVDEGFTKYLKEYKSKKSKTEENNLPDVNIGDEFDIKKKEVKEKYTAPPKHFTEVIFCEV